MKRKIPQDFQDVRLDLDVDLGERGGLQRFRKLGELQVWLDEEVEFWKWLEEPPAGGLLRKSFGQLKQDFDSALNAVRHSLGEFNQIYRRNLGEFTSAAQQKDGEEKAAQLERICDRWEEDLQRFRSNTETLLKRTYAGNPTRLFRGLPEAQFVAEIAKEDPSTAVFVLAQFIQDMRGPGGTDDHQTKGRALALLFSKGWIPKKPAQSLAYGETVKTWQKELGHFKGDFEERQAEFESIRQSVETELQSWRETSQKLQDQFREQQSSNADELAALKDTFVGFMQLHAPMVYWRGKRREHTIAIGSWNSPGSWTFWCIAVAIFGIIALILGSALILPEATPSNEIPWKRIGAFLMLATVVIWVMRFPFKMLLSHIHLRNDAKEREVMISTYMALLRGARGDQGVSKDDIGAVLAAIFRPATSGIIKEDGAPLSAVEMAAKLAK